MTKKERQLYDRVIAAICYMVPNESDRDKLIDFTRELRDEFKKRCVDKIKGYDQFQRDMRYVKPEVISQALTQGIYGITWDESKNQLSSRYIKHVSIDSFYLIEANGHKEMFKLDDYKDTWALKPDDIWRLAHEQKTNE